MSRRVSIVERASVFFRVVHVYSHSRFGRMTASYEYSVLLIYVVCVETVVVECSPQTELGPQHFGVGRGWRSCSVHDGNILNVFAVHRAIPQGLCSALYMLAGFRFSGFWTEDLILEGESLLSLRHIDEMTLCLTTQHKSF